MRSNVVVVGAAAESGSLHVHCRRVAVARQIQTHP
jgi:hypothetical protein